MRELAQKCVAAARNVAEGSPTLGKLIRLLFTKNLII